MGDKELLLAISDIIDKKMKEGLQPVKNELHETRSDIQIIKEGILHLQDRMQAIEERIQTLEERIQTLEESFLHLQNQLHLLQLQQENMIMPRLNTIESCYTDTFYRYKTYADKMDTVFEDVDLLKNTVTDHSQKLQKLA